MTFSTFDLCFEQLEQSKCVLDTSFILKPIDELFLQRSSEQKLFLSENQLELANGFETNVRVNNTCLQIVNNSNVFLPCIEPLPTITLTPLTGNDNFNIRDSTETLCLTAATSENGSNSTEEELSLTVETCFDSDNCSIDCEEREVNQAFVLVFEEQTQAPTTTQRTPPPKVVPYRPFDSTFEIIYQSSILLTFFAVIVLFIKKYDLVPESVSDFFSGRRRKHKHLLEGIELGKPKPELNESI